MLLAFGLTLALQAVSRVVPTTFSLSGSHVCRVVRRACSRTDGERCDLCSHTRLPLADGNGGRSTCVGCCRSDSRSGNKYSGCATTGRGSTLATLLAQEQERRGEAESESSRKSVFLAQVAHELRQPLGAITTAAALLDPAAVSPATKDRAIGVITRQAEHLRRLVDDLLDLSRMTRHELQLRRVNMDICDVVEDCCHSIQPDATGRGVRFMSSLPDCLCLFTLIRHASGRSSSIC